MSYISTRGQSPAMSFQDAVMTGLARDGGLLLPAAIPDVRRKLDAWRGLSYTDLAYEVMRLYVDLSDADLRRLIAASYATFRHREVTPVVPVGGLHVMELFHGPTLAFKDVALQFLGGLFEHILERTGKELNILAATSGDTGSAAICGVRGKERIRIFVTYPNGRVSPTQERQMTTVLDANVFSIALDGTFDDCQAIVKRLFSDLPFRDRYSLGAVNSINWARILAQIVYYFYGVFRVMEKTGAPEVRVAVPTGNFGDVFAGYIAWRMGLPIRRLILATNENDILARFFQGGTYSLGAVHETISPSMDIQVASNFERYLYYRAGEDPAVLRGWMTAFAAKGRLDVPRPSGSADEEVFASGAADTRATLATIRRFYDEHGYLLDPHTAVGVHVALRQPADPAPLLCLATAHPAKFSEAIKDATGRDLAHHPDLDRLAALPTRRAELPAADGAVRDFIRQHIGVAAAWGGAHFL